MTGYLMKRLCGAHCKRTGQPCRAPAMANGRCRVHGGLSTSRRSEEGLERLRRQAWRHGRRSKAYVRLRKALFQHRQLLKAALPDPSAWQEELIRAGEEIQRALLDWESTRQRMQKK